MFIPSHVQDGHSKGSLASTLGVELLDVAQPADQLFTGNTFTLIMLIINQLINVNILTIRILVSLSNQPEFIGQQVGIRGETSHATNHVIIQFVNLLRVKHFVQKLVGVSSLSSQHNAVIGQNSFKNISR